MCGICGYIDYKNVIPKNTIAQMVESLIHRGPDAQDYVDFFDQCHIAMGHDRLAILDLTDAGHQPMTYNDKILVYNGEIYNFKEIKKELMLLGHTFKSECDTEVILHAFDEWGMRCVNNFIGMFAFAIFDRKTKKLYLCRDRSGVKPLFYYEKDGLFAFSSELKAILQIPDIDKTIDQSSLSMMFILSYIPLDNCIFKYAHKLLPGHWLIYDLENHNYHIDKYWDLQDYYRKDKLQISYKDALDELLSLLKSSLSYRMIADVPVGIFLSGGYDSALITAILTQDLGYDISSFTIGFRDGNNEAPIAEKIAKLLGTKHTTRYCEINDAVNLIPKLPYYYDEPYNNPGSIAFMLVSELAKEKVTVAISADGADELFGGYIYYDDLFSRYDKINKINKALPQNIKFISRQFDGIIRKYSGINRGRTLMKDLTEIRLSRKKYIMNRYSAIAHSIKKILPHAPIPIMDEIFSSIDAIEDSPEYGLLFDYKALMVDNYVVKIERGSMFTSLECRAPFLDHRIAEFAARLPIDYKIDSSGRKKLIRDLTYRYIPKSLIDKPKTGFTVPWENWVRTYMKKYVCETLSEGNIRNSGLNIDESMNILDTFFLTGRDTGIVWSLFQYVAWYNKWIRNIGSYEK